MFIGRKNELNTLNKRYATEKFEFIVVYGRRRVGKTALLNHFLENKKAVYFMGVESNEKQNLENISKEIAEVGTGIPTDTIFQSFQSALEYMFQLGMKERICLVIDEYPYVARVSKSLASTLQMLIDKYKDVSKLMLILCGSSMSYMEDEVLAYKAPLYGRRTAQMKILPFDFFETCSCMPTYSNHEKALLYGVLGGTPQYVLQINSRLSVRENIEELLFTASSALYEEPMNLLKQEVRDPTLYNAVVSAIAKGASRLSEISTKVGENTSVCTSYVKNLISLGLVIKETPYGEKESKKTIYSIEDNLFRFWYRFIPESSSMIARGASEIAYNRVEPHISDYMGRVFEDICKQYLWRLLLNGDSPVAFKDLGRWWGNDPREKKQTEIDIMGEADRETALFAECKWTNAKVDMDVYDTLHRRSSLFHYKNVHLFLFSKSGFTDSCREAARGNKNVHLITFDEMMVTV